MDNIMVDDFNKVDLQEVKLPMIVIYKKPKDFPDKYVARLWDGDKATNIISVHSDISQLRNRIPNFMFRLPRQENDDKCIVEVFL